MRKRPISKRFLQSSYRNRNHSKKINNDLPSDLEERTIDSKKFYPGIRCMH